MELQTQEKIIQPQQDSKQCWCYKCRQKYILHDCDFKDNNYYCKKCGKKLKQELVLSETANKTIKTGIRNNGNKYTVRTNHDAYLTPEQWILFYNKLNDHQKITFMFLLHTGGRIMEVQHLKPENIQKTNKLLTFEITKTRSAGGERNCRPRPVKMSSKFIAWYKALDLNKIITEEGYFDILTTPAANICMKKTLQDIGVKNWFMFSVHNIRKTNENWLIALGYDLIKVAKRLGHTYGTAMNTYIQEDVFTTKQKDLIKDILGNDIYEKASE